MKEERWRDLPEWEGIYSVSDHGRIRSEARHITYSNGSRHFVPERVLKLVPDSKGRLRAQLFRNNRGFTRYAHQAVLAAFIGPRPSNLQVCHNNGNPLDNRLSNLRYDTDSANKLDAVMHGTHANAKKTHCPSRHPYDAANTKFGSNGARYCRACQSGQRLVHR